MSPSTHTPAAPCHPRAPATKHTPQDPAQQAPTRHHGQSTERSSCRPAYAHTPSVHSSFSAYLCCLRGLRVPLLLPFLPTFLSVQLRVLHDETLLSSSTLPHTAPGNTTNPRSPRLHPHAPSRSHHLHPRAATPRRTRSGNTAGPPHQLHHPALRPRRRYPH